MTFTLFRGVCSDEIYVVTHPYVAQLVKIASVCRLCRSFVACLGKKLARKDWISALLDIMLNDDDSLLNLRCAKCKRRVEERAMMDLTKFKGSVAVLQSELSLHTIIVS